MIEIPFTGECTSRRLWQAQFDRYLAVIQRQMEATMLALCTPTAPPQPPTFAYRVLYKRRNGRLRQIPREAHHSDVRAVDDSAARIQLWTDYDRRGFEVLRIEQIQPGER